jgi:alkylation response protein AidB-like acyl-CoA dehydrogenase
MEFALDDDTRLIAATIRRFVDRDVRAWAADADRRAQAPAALVDVAGDVGFFIDAVPASAGGLLDEPYSHLTRAVRALELGRGCAAVAALLECNVEPALAVATWGSDRARQEVFSALVRGALATTAYDFSGSLAIETRGEDLRVSGRIGPLPALAAAEHVLVAGRVQGEPVLFVLPAAAGKVTAKSPSGWRAARWGSMSCDSALVPGAMVLYRGEGEAVRAVLSWYRVCLAARAVGVATAAMEHAQRYGEERVQFGQPIGAFESLVRLRDRNETHIAAARLLVLCAAWQLDKGMAEAADTASRARDLACEVVARATIDAVQIFGGYGYVNDYPVEKLMRDARAFEALLGNEAFDRVLDRLPEREPGRVPGREPDRVESHAGAPAKPAA